MDNHNKDKRMRVFLVLGRMPYRTFRDIVNRNPETLVCGLLASSPMPWSSELATHKTGISVWIKRDLDNPCKPLQSTPCHEEYDRCLTAIMSDARTYYLAERTYGVGGASSTFNHALQIEMLCWNSLAVLYETQPDRVIFNTTPHNVRTWIFGRVAELMGIPVYMIKVTPLPWRSWAVRGIDAQLPVNLEPAGGAGSVDAVPSARAMNYFDMNAGDYNPDNTSIPPYERCRTGKRKNYLLLWKEELKWLPRLKTRNLILHLRNAAYKNNLLSTYKRLSGSVPPSGTYIVFFLHYQPERTSLPEGYGYAQQWRVIRTLATALPEGLKLVVKEHPSTFWKPMGMIVRTDSFYKAVTTLPNACLAPLESDTFELIDGSAAVATLTGTVGFQALCRGRPVLTFGAAMYRGCPGVFPVHAVNQVREALKIISSGNANPTPQQVAAFLAWVESISIEGQGAHREQDPYAHDIKEDGTAKVLDNLLGCQHEPPAVSFT